MSRLGDMSTEDTDLICSCVNCSSGDPCAPQQQTFWVETSDGPKRVAECVSVEGVRELWEVGPK